MSVNEVSLPALNDEITKIDFVNDDCLSIIFKYVPSRERPKIALVCKKWKEILRSSWGDVKKLKFTYWSYNKNCLNKFANIRQEFCFVYSMLYNCGKFLNELDLTAFCHRTALPIVNNHCRNVMILRIRWVFSNKIVRFNNYALSNLSNLKTLSVIFQGYEHQYIPTEFIDSLNNVAKSLTDLIIANWRDYIPSSGFFPEEKIPVLGELKALKRLEIGGIDNPEKIFHYLKSNNHELSVLFNYDMMAAVPGILDLKEIRTLNLLNFSYITDEVLYTVVNTMENLSDLQFNGEYITNDGIVSISNINNLRNLDIWGKNDKISDSLKLLKNLKLLRLPNVTKTTDDIISAVLENSPELYLLHIPESAATVQFFKTAANILNTREQRLAVKVPFDCDFEEYATKYLEILPKEYCPSFNSWLLNMDGFGIIQK